MSAAPTPHAIILGAGPAGLGAAYRLARRGGVRVTVIERGRAVGGNAGSFELAGQAVDYGSHRLHPACDPEVLRDIRALLGDDLLDRPRRGRIRLRGRWIHFPLKPVDLALRLPPAFALGVGADILRKAMRIGGRRTDPETFASVLEAGLGRTICRDFYFPYAEKVWGLPATELAAIQARRRVSAGSLAKMARKVLAAIPVPRPRDAGRFYYPRSGYGQISRAYHQAAEAAGATFVFGAAVSAVERADDRVLAVWIDHDSHVRRLHADHVWSTIPVSALVAALRPAAPDAVLEASRRIEFRAMILVYLVLEQDRFTEYDAHYFPAAEIRISRLSEPKNYGLTGTPNRTVLCAELPCSPVDPEWRLADDDLGRLVGDALDRAGLPLRAAVKEVAVRRLQHAYPIYRRGYEAHFALIDGYLDRITNLLTFGRQGLFAHDNTHHALFMAYAAADCLGADGRFDRGRWHDFRRVFATHVVED
jgi:protoporphyrinogen oxidase